MLKKFILAFTFCIVLLPASAWSSEDSVCFNNTLTATAATPSAFLENSQIIASGNEIQIFRLPTTNTNGRIKYYDLSIPLTITSNGTIGVRAPVTSTLSPNMVATKFIPGTYTDNAGATCQVTTSTLNSGRMEVAVACTCENAESNPDCNLSSGWATGPITGHPFEIDLLQAGIDKISGAADYAWGVVGYSSWNHWHWYNASITSARQVGNIITITN